MKARMPLNVEVLRGPVVESQHQVMAVVIDERALPVAYWGNTDFVTYPRSAIKMLQALALLESGAAEAFHLTDAEIALACSSHAGEKKHIEGVAEFMKKTGVHEEQLFCGGHWPGNEAAAHEMIRKGAKPTPIVNNCSGKHTGIICTCLHLKENPAGYQNYEHPAQVRLRKVLSEVMRVDHNKLPHGIDGCGIPTYAVPLQNMAMGMLALINPKESERRREAAKRILDAVKHEPFYVGGTHRFSTEVIQHTRGSCIVKNGAEGVMCGVIPEKGLAFAVKAEDGAGRAVDAATGYILQKLNVLKEAEVAKLKPIFEPKIKNWKGLEVGSIRVSAP